MKVFQIIVLGLLSLASFYAFAQPSMTIDQCISTANVRAGLSLTSAQIRNLCEKNPQSVVDCTLNVILSRSATMRLDGALKECQRDLIRYH